MLIQGPAHSSCGPHCTEVECIRRFQLAPLRYHLSVGIPVLRSHPQRTVPQIPVSGTSGNLEANNDFSDAREFYA